ncbi:MAG: sensor histidine kinase [Anaerolineales bacterium]|nr:sensor histidine kinase [Anaerolineales bacterium]
MKSARLEPGILALFRLFLVIQLLLILVNVTAHSARGYLIGCPWCAVAFGSVSILLMLGYLSWPWLQSRLGAAYLPIALVFAALVSLILQDLFLDMRASSPAVGSEESAWQLFLFLFVPLVLISWQYDFRAVVAYCLFTAVLDYALMHCGRDDFYLVQQTYKRLIFIRFLSFMLVGYIIARIVEQLRQQRQALQQANLKLGRYAATLEQLAVSRERNRMARELHDVLAHTLSGLAVQLEAVNSLWNNDRERAHHILQGSLKATRDGLTETRKAIQALRASPLEELGLAAAIGAIAESVAKCAGFQLILDLPPNLDGLPLEVEQCFYRVCQEALENAARHAAAKHVWVGLFKEGPKLRMEIRDDGVGFDPQSVDCQGCYGLQGMQERARMIGSALEISSQPDQGSAIRLAWSEYGNQDTDL